MAALASGAASASCSSTSGHVRNIQQHTTEHVTRSPNWPANGRSWKQSSHESMVDHQGQTWQGRPSDTGDTFGRPQCTVHLQGAVAAGCILVVAFCRATRCRQLQHCRQHPHRSACGTVQHPAMCRTHFARLGDTLDAAPCCLQFERAEGSSGTATVDVSLLATRLPNSKGSSGTATVGVNLLATRLPNSKGSCGTATVGVNLLATRLPVITLH